MLQKWNHFYHAHVVEQLIILLLILAVEDEVGSEDEDRCSKYWQNLQSLEANNSVPQEIDLVDFENAYEAEHDPREYGLQRRNIQLSQMIAHFRLIRLQQLLKKFAHAQNALRVAGDGI